MHVMLSLVLYVIAIHSLESDGQRCVDMVNVQQPGSDRLNVDSQVVTSMNVSCYGRLTGYLVSLNQDDNGNDYPHITLWRRLSTGYLYKIKDYVITENDIIQMSNYYFANVSFAINEATGLQPGDLFGYYQPDSPHYTVWSINTTGYTSYIVSTIASLIYSNYVYASGILDTVNDRQPLIQILYDIRCDDLSTPANGEIVSCSSGTEGVGYEGDTCSFTCNTGYELIGSDTRTCQSNGSWSGSDDVCRRVQCPAPANVILQCQNGATTGVFEDTCTFSCNAGYELQGSNTGTCLASQSWSGGDPICVALNCSTSPPLNNSQLQSSCDTQYQSTCTTNCVDGYTGVGGSYTCVVTDEDTNSVGWNGSTSCQRVQCPTPTNVILQCPNGATTGVFEDTCTFSCNAGYELRGSSTGTCLANQSWSGGNPICVALNCTTSPPLNNSQLQSSCDTQPQSTCTTVCVDGYTGLGGSYTCVVTTNSVGWIGSTSCQRVQCPTLPNGILQCPNGATAGVFEDTCTFSCNAGYELQGSNNGTCLANQNWSGGDPICVALNCPTSPPLNNSRLQSSCDTQYQSTCTTDCVDGYTGVGGSYTCVVTDEDTNSVGWNGSTSCQIDVISSGSSIAEGESSNTAAAVAGSIVAVVSLVIACVIIFLVYMWYRKWKKEKQMNESEPLKVNGGKVLSHCTAVQDNVIYYELNGGAIKNGMYSNPTYYSSIDNNCAKTTAHHDHEPVPYLDPMKTGSSANDYEEYPMMNVYEQPELFPSAHIPNPYETADTLTSSAGANTLHLGEELSDNEPIYEDPGHIHESIYEWLEQKGILKLDSKIVRVLQKLGSGEFGVVNLGLWSNGSADPVQVAVKTLNSQCSESDRVKFLREAAIMGQFVHNNVVQLHGVVTEEEKMMIVLEYMPKGDLQNHLLKIKPVDLQIQEKNTGLHYDPLSYCRQIAAGMSYLTTKCFVHRDLAARNILLSSENVCKIADFGMARDVTDDTYYVTSGGKIPVKWTAPEAIFYKKYSVQSDVWSFGCVMYEIWSLGHKPFEDLSAKEYIQRITTGYRLPPPPGCPRAIYELMIQCWHPEAKSRPQSKSVLSTLQKSDETLLHWSLPANDKTDGQATLLGAPLTAGEQLYPDLQSQYKTT